MPKEVIIDNENTALWYHTTKKIVHHVIHKPIFGKALQECLEKGIALLKKHNAKKWLSDYRKNGAMLKDDVDWIDNEWYPRAAMTDWKHWAIVLPEKTVGQLSMNRIATIFAQPGFDIKTFTDPDEAMSWLIGI